MLYAYNPNSQSAINLSKALGIKMIKHQNSTFKGASQKMVLNWGASEIPEQVKKCKVINHPSAVKRASNKLTFFQHVGEEINIPRWTTNFEDVKDWPTTERPIVGRTVLNGHSGKGIVLLSREEVLADKGLAHGVKLYVEYIPKKEEYRVHVVNGKVIDVRRKARDPKFPKELCNWQIRNHQNGFIFQKDNFEAPEDVLTQALKTVEICKLHFGAVDVIWNSFQNKAYVLEVNTAPGLDGSTIDNYKKAFEELFYNKGRKIGSKGLTLDDLEKVAVWDLVQQNPNAEEGPF